MHPLVQSMLLLKEHPVAKVERLQIKRWYARQPRKREGQRAGRIHYFDSDECALLNIKGTFIAGE